jgi:hypothetical protein
MRLKTKGFIESSTLGAILNERREGTEGEGGGRGGGFMKLMK